VCGLDEANAMLVARTVLHATGHGPAGLAMVEAGR
jgi:hypothetical protein